MKMAGWKIWQIALIFTCLMVDVKDTWARSCFSNREVRSSRARITNIWGDNEPLHFANCPKYKQQIKEEQPEGTPVITLRAEEEVFGLTSGRERYYFIPDSPEQAMFHINNVTGEITTKHVFNRDEPIREREVQILVRAVKRGLPQLEAICLFTVTIEDINDNAPVFDKKIYRESIPLETKLGSEVMRISAVDIDDGPNADFDYVFSEDREDYDFFEIDEKTGAIKLTKKISKPIGYVFQLQAHAVDRKSTEPPDQYASVDLEIKVIESDKEAPMFVGHLPGPVIELYENFTSVTQNIAVLRAVPNTEETPPLFQLISGPSEETNGKNTFVLRTNARKDIAYIRYSGSVPLDYETLKEYTLTVRVENEYTLAVTHSFKIQLLDVNDNSPKFKKGATLGHVFENQRVGTEVMKAQAIDEDETPAFNTVTYELGDSTDLFDIHPDTGVITTKQEFDRELRESYNVTVIAKDGATSAILNNGEPNSAEQVFRIYIADLVDNAPQFDRREYIAFLSENPSVGSKVIDLNATNMNDGPPLLYIITGGNKEGEFEIERRTGVIKTKTELDSRKTNYRLKVKATDSFFSAECFVEIKITNVSDGMPVLPRRSREIKNDEKKDITGYTAKVEAHDPDVPADSSKLEDLKKIFRDRVEGAIGSTLVKVGITCWLT